MAMNKQSGVVLAVIAFAVVVAGIAYQRQQQKAEDITNETIVRSTVEQFGTSMQKVSLSAPDALQQIATTYSPYASSSLISYWQANHSFAPGKGLSSPWPSGITIEAVTKKGNTYIVEGLVTEVTSQEVAHGGIAAEFPVTITLGKYKGQWLITGYSAGVETTFASKLPTTTNAK